MPTLPISVAEWFETSLGDGASRVVEKAEYTKGDGIGTKKNDKKTIEWYIKAGECCLAYYYNNGNGVAKYPAKVYTKAAEKENSDAEFNLRVCYINGEGATKNLEKAVEWYTKAVEKGNSDPQYNEDGDGVTKNLTKAVEWYIKATEKGHSKTQYDLAICYENGCD
ncbi:hypothetical protein G9A89_022994 [Geosiphon pyriformis]|nr:hypothetical protein G9A89_022994 [Geosiphon pyriformis]